MKKEIGLRIKKIREDMNLTKEEFSKKIGITSQFLCMIENGKNCLSIEKLKKLCDFTGYTSDYILFGESEKQSKINLNKISKSDLNTTYTTLKAIYKLLN